MNFKIISAIMPDFAYRTYVCPICGKDIPPKTPYTFIDPYTDKGIVYIKGGFTCTREECINMCIFQMME